MNMRGFTLIETLIYIALLSVLLGGSLLATTHLLLSQQSHTQTTPHVFVMQKIRFALSYGSPLIPGVLQPLSTSLVVTRGGETSTIERTHSTVTIVRGTHPQEQLSPKEDVVGHIQFLFRTIGETPCIETTLVSNHGTSTSLWCNQL